AAGRYSACLRSPLGGLGFGGGRHWLWARAVRFRLTHRALPLELEAVGVMHEPIEDGVGEGGFANEVVPGFDGELTGDQRRAAGVALLDDLHEVAPLAGVEAVGTEVVE